METSEDVNTFYQEDLPCASFTAFEEMRIRGILCDLTLKVRNQSFTVHRVVLAAGIPYFQSLYMNGETETGTEEISRENLDPKALESLIQFAYTSKVDISFDNVYSVIRTSHFLRLVQVFHACVQFLLSRLDTNNVVLIHTLAHEFTIEILIERTSHYMRENFDTIFERDDFLSLPHSCIKEIISEDYLNVSSEETVFEAAIKWVKASPSERYEILPELLSDVRLVCVDADYLINRVTAEKLVRTSKRCLDLLEDVKNYHLLHKDRKSLIKLKTRPRKFYYSDGGIYALWQCQTTGYSVYHCDLDKGRISHNLATQSALGEICAIAAVNEKIYMFHDEKIQTLQVRSLEWETLQLTHKTMKGAAVVSQGHMIYCFGSTNANLSDKVRCFDTRQNKWAKTGKMNTGRFNSAAASLENTIYVTGGFWDYSAPSYMYLLGYSGGNAVEKYNTAKRKCSKATPMLSSRENHFCTGLNGKIYVCGGLMASGFINTAEVYDPLTAKWSFISSMPFARSSFAMVSHRGKIYALQGERRYVYFETYDPESDNWSPGPALNTDCCLECRLRLVCCVNII